LVEERKDWVSLFVYQHFFDCTAAASISPNLSSNGITLSNCNRRKK
jgi:hypothetical protein